MGWCLHIRAPLAATLVVNFFIGVGSGTINLATVYGQDLKPGQGGAVSASVRSRLPSIQALTDWADHVAAQPRPVPLWSDRYRRHPAPVQRHQPRLDIRPLDRTLRGVSPHAVDRAQAWRFMAEKTQGKGRSEVKGKGTGRFRSELGLVLVPLLSRAN